MRVLAHRLVLLLAMLAFTAGMPLALAVPPALASEPCPHEHHVDGGVHHEHQHPQNQHRHDAAGCLCCCIGTCIGVPDLPRGAAVAAPYTMATIAYPERIIALVGRSLRPDPAPPRSSALS